MRELWGAETGRLSVQVLQEFYLNAAPKIAMPVARATAREILKIYGVWVRRATTVETVTRAREIADLEGISFRDAVIVAAAEEVDAQVLLSAEFNDGQAIAGINVVNPLTDGPMGSAVHDDLRELESADEGRELL